jgi:hypothetical protein
MQPSQRLLFRSLAPRAEKMALFGLEKAPFSAVFLVHPVFAHAEPRFVPGAAPRADLCRPLRGAGRMQRTLPPDEPISSLPILGAGQPRPRAENRERGQREARWPLPSRNDEHHV